MRHGRLRSDLQAAASWVAATGSLGWVQQAAAAAELQGAQQEVSISISISAVYTRMINYLLLSQSSDKVFTTKLTCHK